MHKRLFLSTATKYQLWIGLFAGLWLSLFLVFIGPFDVAPLSIEIRLITMPGYGILFAASYILAISLQKPLLGKSGISGFWKEIIVILLVFSIAFPLSFLYYRSGHINGDFPFVTYVFQSYLPIVAILFPLLLITRRWVAVRLNNATRFVILGKNKYDLLRLSFADLIYVKGADNYVEVHYLKDHTLQSRLIRSTLKEVKQQVPQLVQTHRSYLMNATHFIAWNGQNQLSLTMSEIPVSATYKNSIPELAKIRP